MCDDAAGMDGVVVARPRRPRVTASAWACPDRMAANALRDARTALASAAMRARRTRLLLTLSERPFSAVQRLQLRSRNAAGVGAVLGVQAGGIAGLAFQRGRLSD